MGWIVFFHCSNHAQERWREEEEEARLRLQAEEEEEARMRLEAEEEEQQQLARQAEEEALG